MTDAYTENAVSIEEFLDAIRAKLKPYPIIAKSAELEIGIAITPTGDIVIANSAYPASAHIKITMGMVGIEANMAVLK